MDDVCESNLERGCIALSLAAKGNKRTKCFSTESTKGI